MVKVLKNVTIDGKVTDLVAEDGKIRAIGKCERSGEDCEGLELYPGLFDTHVHGAVGYDTMEISNGGLAEMAQFELSAGTTSFLPTTMTMDIETIRSVVNRDLPRIEGGAKVEGFHMEGPYIADKYKGAQNGAFIKSPTMAEFSTLRNIKKLTLAPELPGAIDFIAECCAATDTLISLGHTATDYATAIAAMENGAACLTHTFNAMSPLHHRDPGPIGAAVEKGAYAEVISDGLHVSRAAILTLYRTFGPDRLILVSDGLRATGLGDGEFSFGGQKIFVREGVARIEAGNLAGSTTTLFGCVRKAVEFGIPKRDALRMASATPARSLGMKKGELCVGYDAEFILLDADMNLVRSLIL
ncbi:MAG: N-acetylglucosamine-6-phosphate deacetylase [Clostridia bacterium]|nr:N-acetylglucosamine-6-phosphate deacetylase [Clostridia bacterium]